MTLMTDSDRENPIENVGVETKYMYIVPMGKATIGFFVSLSHPLRHMGILGVTYGDR